MKRSVKKGEVVAFYNGVSAEMTVFLTCYSIMLEKMFFRFDYLQSLVEKNVGTIRDTKYSPTQTKFGEKE